MGGEFAAPSLKGFKPAVLACIKISRMGGEFAAPSLKVAGSPGVPIHLPHVWAANLPPPH